MAAEVSKLNGLRYINPRLPLNIRLPEKLSAGKKIHVHGTVFSSATRFSVNCKDAGVGGNTFFHFNPRFGDDNIVVRNSRYNDAWGDEERGDNPFSPGSSFLLTITAQEEAYEVTVNGEPFITFQCREEMPLNNVSHVVVKGDIACHAVVISVSPMSVPLTLDIPDNLHAGDHLVISGETPGDASRFALNLQCGSQENADIMLHFNPRFDEGEVVCNSRCADTWDSEIRGGLIIGPGQPFVLSIGVSKDAYHTYLQNQNVVEFPHRLEMSTACTLNIEGDVVIKDVHLSCPPTRFHPTMADTIKELESPSTSFCGCSPSKLALPGPFQPGQMAVVDCFICPEPTRFSINLQCGEGDDDDIALHFNPRWDDDSGSTTVLNSRNGGSWGDEERTDNKMEPNTYATIIIYCTYDGFSIGVNGEILVPSFSHRMDCQSVTHIVVEGCSLIQRIMAA